MFVRPSRNRSKVWERSLSRLNFKRRTQRLRADTRRSCRKTRNGRYVSCYMKPFVEWMRSSPPRLITEDMVRDMRPGSVIVDMAAEAGGNCEVTEVGKSVVRHGVTIIGPYDLATTVPAHASQMDSRNISSLVLSQVKNRRLDLNFEDEIVNAMVVTHMGEMRA